VSRDPGDRDVGANGVVFFAQRPDVIFAAMLFLRPVILSNSIDCIWLHYVSGPKYRHVVQKGILFVVINEAHVPVQVS
jgi:hypothetical protein